MLQTLRDFINAREGEVKAQIKALNDELRELRAAKSAIDGEPAPGAERAPSSRMTHRDMIVAVLNERPEGGTSDKVIEWVSEKFGVDIPQASMSSQLSRAKSDNVLALDQPTKVWTLFKHRKNLAKHIAEQSENSGPAEPEKANAEGAEDTLGVLNLQPRLSGQ